MKINQTGPPRSLHVDIESYSAEPLPKCGVYRYSGSSTFEILLLSYAFDDEPIVTIDMACGEKPPQEFWDALEDPSVLKIAHNAAFERVCFSRYLGHWLDPHQWRCSMVMAAYNTMPLSLANVAVALNVTEKKMEEGKDLIRYFSVPCKPTKTNGGRTRNLPEHAPEKWEVYKSYNKQDVETERAVVSELMKHPLPDSEWELYALDQIINDRGVRIDKQLVKQAMAIDSAFTDKAYARAQEITGLENPSSVIQLKAWLADNDAPMESLAKKLVQEKAGTTEGIVGELLNLRLELSKTSVKKYEAIARSVCKDGRVHGMLQFGGASRTMRWCLTGDHEVLTPDGWIRLDAWGGGYIACWTSNGEITSFQKAKALCFPYEGPMYTYESTRISQISTPDHRMPTYDRYGQFKVETVEEMARHRPTIPFTGRRTANEALGNYRLRVLIMTQADGSFAPNGDVSYHFKKQRKIERCKMLLRRAGITFYCSPDHPKHGTTFHIRSRHVPLWLRLFKDKIFGPWLLNESPDIVFDEIHHWDGSLQTENSIQYVTCNKQNADMVQALAHTTGRAALILTKEGKKEEHRTSYVVDIWLNPGNRAEIRDKPTITQYSGNVYCAETPTGFFLVRRNGKVWVTGNSGKLVQVQNLPQNHLPDLELAREIVKNGDEETLELLFGSVPNTLSELIRTAFIPREGCRFIVADFSAIEARVLAWLAGEEWVLDEFRGAGKIYEETASRMFHIPKDTIVKGHSNYEYRQKGKQATLSCGYGGGVGALKAMGAKMPEEEMQPLVDAWRGANPHIVAFWNAMDKAARKAIGPRHETTRVGKVTVFWQNNNMYIQLPAGRQLCYISPRMVTNRFGNDGIGYLAPNASGQMSEQETFGGKLVENITQSIARDLLAHAMMNLEKAGYPIVFHVHDEAVMEVPSGQGSLEEAYRIMAIQPEWAKDLPLKADGGEMMFYQK